MGTEIKTEILTLVFATKGVDGFGFCAEHIAAEPMNENDGGRGSTS